MRPVKMFVIVFLVGLFLGICAGTVSADPYLGQSVVYRYNSSYEYNAVVTEIIDSTTVGLVAFGDGNTWFNSVSSTVPCQVFVYVAESAPGSLDNRWRNNDAVYNYSGGGVSAQGTTSFALNGSAIQLNVDHDTELVLSVKIDLTLTLIAGMGGTVHLFCDASATPTTEVETVQLSHGLGIATTLSQTQVMRWRVAKTQYCKVTTTNDTGSPTFTIARQFSQTIN